MFKLSLQILSYLVDLNITYAVMAPNLHMQLYPFLRQARDHLKPDVSNSECAQQTPVISAKPVPPSYPDLSKSQHPTV